MSGRAFKCCYLGATSTSKCYRYSPRKLSTGEEVRAELCSLRQRVPVLCRRCNEEGPVWRPGKPAKEAGCSFVNKKIFPLHCLDVVLHTHESIPTPLGLDLFRFESWKQSPRFYERHTRGRVCIDSSGLRVPVILAHERRFDWLAMVCCVLVLYST